MLPRPCINGCTCYYSPYNQANTFDCQNQNLPSLPKDVLKGTNWILPSGNNLGNIAQVGKYMENITHLDLSNSHLLSISNDVMESMVKNLKTLKLVNNNLEILPQSIMEANSDTKPVAFQQFL